MRAVFFVTLISIRQDDLETVLPAVGRPVLILNGRHRGLEGILDSIQEKSFSCTVEITQVVLV